MIKRLAELYRVQYEALASHKHFLRLKRFWTPKKAILR